MECARFAGLASKNGIFDAPRGLENSHTGARMTWVLTNFLKLTFRDLSSHICQIFMRMARWGDLYFNKSLDFGGSEICLSTKYRIWSEMGPYSAVKNAIPKIQVPFFPKHGRVQSLSEVCPSMLPAARTPKTKSVPDHFNIEGQASLNDLCWAQRENRLPLFVGLGTNIFHRGRQNHGMCSSVATGVLGNLKCRWSVSGSLLCFAQNNSAV